MDSNHGTPQTIPKDPPASYEPKPVLSDKEIHFDILSTKVIELVVGKYVV